MKRSVTMPDRKADFAFSDTDYKTYLRLGAHRAVEGGTPGVRFAVWAPNAKSVSVLTDADAWNADTGRAERRGDGVWEKFVPGCRLGDRYQYMVVGCDGITRFKADPYAFAAELRPGKCSVVAPLKGYRWNDAEYRAAQNNRNVPARPMAIYEVHLGSWKKDFSRGEDGFLNYRELADQLSDYLSYMGYTHVELIGVCEHPLDASWGYQVTGFFAPTARYGSPDDFRYFVDKLHQSGIGVILDWVPAHFPKDDFALENFDGTPLYEHADPLRAEYPEWGTKAFDHGKPEVRNFLLSSAYYWVKEFHVDGLRVDAVASMLHNSFGRREWRKNAEGGDENLESIAFLKEFNRVIRAKTRAFTVAEDSSIMSGITDPPERGGIGFHFKWNMGWMNDTLKYVEKDPLFRGWHHGNLTHSIDYAFLEDFVLVLSHDEVVHLKHSMLEKFPGGLEDKLGGLKTLYTYQMTHPGKKLLFMGQEFAEDREWMETREINWALADDPGHRDVMECLRSLLSIYKKYPCLYSDSRNPVTFEWVNKSDAMRSTVSYLRRNPWNYDGALLVICNFSPLAYDYDCGVPVAGSYKRIFSTYDALPGGGGPAEIGKEPILLSSEAPCDGYQHRVTYGLRAYESIILALQ